MKRIISLLLTLTLILGATSSLSSCGSIIDDCFFENVENDGGSRVEPDSSLGTDGTNPGTENDFIENGYQDTDYSNLTPESKGLLACVRITSGFEKSSGYNVVKYNKEGSGVIINLDKSSGDAYILTNFHVVYDKLSISQNHISNNIGLFLYGQESDTYRIEATFVGGSLSHDLAVLRVQDSEVIRRSHAMAGYFADSDKINVLDDVIAVGNPEGLGISVTEGTVSIVDKKLSLTGADGKTTISLRVMRISAAINEGNSGGGVYDDKGNLIGIVCAKRSGEEVDNMAYAIPSNLARMVADIIIDTCDGSSAGFSEYQLGLFTSAKASGIIIDEATGKITRIEYVMVASVNQNSPLVGLVGVGDVIKSITVDGVTTEVTRAYHVNEAMLTAREGDRVSLSLDRDGISFTRTITVTADMLVFTP